MPWTSTRTRMHSTIRRGGSRGEERPAERSEADKLRIPPGSWNAPKERTTSGEGRGPGGRSGPLSEAKRTSCGSPLACGTLRRSGPRVEREGVQGGGAARSAKRSGQAADPPWFVGRSEGADHEWTSRDRTDQRHRLTQPISFSRSMSAIQDASVLVGRAESPAPLERIGRLWTYRGLLLNLIKRDLRIRYKESALGFLWSMLNPATYLAIFYVVFVILLPAGIPNFPVFILSGLLPWTLFQNSMMAARTSVVGGAPLLKRVAFPREVLPLAAVGANIFHFFLQMIVLLGFMLIFRYNFASKYLVLVIPALVVEVLILAGFSLILSSITVYMRDMAHFIELATLFWFWMTPIVYAPAQVYVKLVRHHIPYALTLLNPMSAIVLS